MLKFKITNHFVHFIHTHLYVCIMGIQALSITEMFARQLMQISGVGMEKAAAIIEAYSTPIRLVDSCDGPLSSSTRKE